MESGPKKGGILGRAVRRRQLCPGDSEWVSPDEQAGSWEGQTRALLGRPVLLPGEFGIYWKPQVGF